MGFVNAHYPAYISDLGYSTGMVAAVGPIVGVGSITGAVFFGRLSDMFGRKRVLGLCYGLRSLGFGLLLLSQSVPGIVIGTVIIGLSWTSVMSGTAAVASEQFGVRRLTSIYSSIVTMSPFASFFGTWIAGRIYDQTARNAADGIGSYDLAILINFFLPLAAVGVVFFIHDQRAISSQPVG